MRVLLALVLMACASLGADGYKDTMWMAQYDINKTKSGEVWRFTDYYAERVSAEDENPVKVTLYRAAKHIGPTLTISMTPEQWFWWRGARGYIFMRRTPEGWQFLGKELYRDKNGQVAYR